MNSLFRNTLVPPGSVYDKLVSESKQDAIVGINHKHIEKHSKIFGYPPNYNSLIYKKERLEVLKKMKS